MGVEEGGENKGGRCREKNVRVGMKSHLEKEAEKVGGEEYEKA